MEAEIYPYNAYVKF